MENIQSLSISGKTRETDKETIVNFVNTLEICGNCLQLNSQSPITSNGEAVFPNHSH